MFRRLGTLGVLACLLAAPAGAEERWRVESARGSFAFYEQLLKAFGARLSPDVRADQDERLNVAFTAAGDLQFDAHGSIFRDVLGGSLRVSSRGVLHGAGGALALRGLELRRGPEERTLQVTSPDGRVWFEADHMHHGVDRAARTLRLYNLDLRLTADAARLLGDVRYTDMAVGVLLLEAAVDIPPGSQEQPDGACTTPNWGAPHGDVALINIGSLQQMARDTTPPARVGIAPSATLKNVGTTDVPWYTKFSGVFPPYNNDQHPFLVWNMYRLAGGALEQIGVSPLKHAFVSVNANCGCAGGNILWVGCEDTYGTGTNDSTGSLGPRSEIMPFTGYWQRCQSIFDVNCDGVQNSAPARANPMDRRMAVLESELTTAGATYYVDSWYVVRDDINIFNTMGWRAVVPTPPGGSWTFALTTPLATGAVIDQWVNPSSPGPNAQSVDVATKFGRLRLAVRATDLGAGQWRYEYALMNFDFEPRIKSFALPLPAGASVSNVGFHDVDQNGATDWTPTVGATSITWQAPSVTAAQDWSTLFNFRFTVNAAPTAAGGATATMGVQAARGWLLQQAVMGPGTLSPLGAETK